MSQSLVHPPCSPALQLRYPAHGPATVVASSVVARNLQPCSPGLAHRSVQQTTRAPTVAASPALALQAPAGARSEQAHRRLSSGGVSKAVFRQDGSATLPAPCSSSQCIPAGAQGQRTHQLVGWSVLQAPPSGGSAPLVLQQSPRTSDEVRKTLPPQPLIRQPVLPAGPHHPPDAYLGPDLPRALRFFRDNGYLLLPDAVPPQVLQRARAAVVQSAAGQPVPSEALRESGIWDFIAKLVRDPLPSNKAQVPKVPRMPASVAGPDYFPQDLHIDGVHSEDGHIENFSLLVGVPLDEFPEPFMGNFGVFPGSHLRLQELFKREGLDVFRHWMEDRAGSLDAWGNFNPRVAWGKRLREIFGQTTYSPLCVKLGQAFVAHYQTVHFVHPNLRGADPRTVMYFRVYARRAVRFQSKELAALTNVWLEYPAIAAMEQQQPAKQA